MKKLIILTLVALTFTVASFGQQVPMYSHYYFNRFLYNPALTGEQSYGQAYLLYRNQWNNLPEAPRTKAFTIDGPLRNKKIGLGFSLYQDNAGAFNSTGGKLSYRYGLQLSKESTLNFGLGLGFIDNRIDFNKLRYHDEGDQLILNNYEPETGFDATFGVNYVYKKLQIGLAVPQVLGNELAYESSGVLDPKTATYTLARHYIATARYDFDINDKLSFEPVAMVRATPGAPVQYDVNAMFNYDNKYWLGAMYRSEYSTTFSAAAKLFDQIVAGYSYDLAFLNGDISKTLRGAGGAHEVMLGYQFGDRTEELSKKVKGINDRVKANEDKIKKNREDIDSNDDDIDNNKKDADEKTDKLQKELDDLKADFDKFKADIESGALKTGDKFAFNNVYFETSKSDIKDVDKAELDKMVEILKDNPNMSIAIIGHADVRGTTNANQVLSRERAAAVRNYLITEGVQSYRLRIESYGELKPISDNLQDNRRVEFKVLSK